MKRIIIYFTLLSIISFGCSESFFDINKNPNLPLSATPKLVLPSAIAASAYVIGGYYQHLGGEWSQHYTQATSASQWENLETFNLDQGDFDRQFRLLYSSALTDYEYIRNTTAASGDWTYNFMATCMQAYTFQVLADLYDQIPFSEALQGASNLNPKYEAGSVIADSLVARIDAVLKYNLSASSASIVGTEDLVFNGAMKRWKQFANTLKLQIYMRWVNVDAEKYRAKITDLLADKTQLLEVAATMTAFKNEENNRNPFYETFIDRLSGNVAASGTLLDTLKYAGDARLPKIFKASETGNVMVGLQQGRYKEDIAIYASYKNLATPNVTGIDPVYFYSLPEVDFLIAEAEFRYGTAANAIAYYQKGIDDSYTQFGLTPNPSIYGVGSAYEYKGLASIMTQKWIAAANCRAIESFFDFNRTGFPTFFKRSFVSTLGAGQFPKRLLFPDSETKTNSNTPALKRVYEKVWWSL